MQCIWCSEKLETLDKNVPPGCQPMHYECFIRSIVGSVAHQQQKCSCYGGTGEDPEGLSRWEAAIAAWKYYNSRLN